MLYSLLSIHISSTNTGLQREAARARMECFGCGGGEQGFTLSRRCLAAAGRILSSFPGVLVSYEAQGSSAAAQAGGSLNVGLTDALSDRAELNVTAWLNPT